MTARRPDATRSAVLMFGTSVMVSALSLVNVLVTSRALGVSGRGQVAFLLTVGSLTAHLATLGVQEANANTASTAPDRTPPLAGNSVVLAVLLGSLAGACLAGVVALAPAVGGSAPRWLLGTVLACLPVLVLHVFLQQIALAHYRFGVMAAAALLTPVLNAAVNTVLALAGVLTVAATVYAWLVGQALATALYALVVARHLGGFGRPDRRLAAASLRFGARAHVGRTLSWGSYRLDQWLVGVLGGDRMLGLYSVAVSWSEMLFLVPQVLQTVARPDLVRSDREQARRQSAAVLRIGVLLVLPAVLGVVVLAPFLCVTVLGPDFAGAVTPLRVLTLGSFGVLALKVYGSALLARGRPMMDSAAVAPALVTMLALDALLVPAAGALGAAVASSVAYLVGGAIAVLLARQVLGGGLRDLVPTPADLRDLRSRAAALRAGLHGPTSSTRQAV